MAFANVIISRHRLLF